MSTKEEAERGEALARLMQREKERERRRQRDRERRQKMSQEQREHHLARRRRNYQLRRIRAQNAKQTRPTTPLTFPTLNLQVTDLKAYVKKWMNQREYYASMLPTLNLQDGSIKRLALIHVKRLARAIKVTI
ncbi:hypothetical protein RND81_12G065700 [Saponaria officinalis]|uniref:Uncharacterized protein n=1 Tax=Saponaria officinalis TaxID=3572 RepID=A0AAW1H7C5_SAPOF